MMAGDVAVPPICSMTRSFTGDVLGFGDTVPINIRDDKEKRSCLLAVDVAH